MTSINLTEMIQSIVAKYALEEDTILTIILADGTRRKLIKKYYRNLLLSHLWRMMKQHQYQHQH